MLVFGTVSRMSEVPLHVQAIYQGVQTQTIWPTSFTNVSIYTIISLYASCLNRMYFFWLTWLIPFHTCASIAATDNPSPSDSVLCLLIKCVPTVSRLGHLVYHCCWVYRAIFPFGIPLLVMLFRSILSVWVLEYVVWEISGHFGGVYHSHCASDGALLYM